MTQITSPSTGLPAWVYRYEASRPDATATAVGASGARSCSNAGALPWSPINWTQASAACASVSDSVGVPMRLCTAEEWTAACNVGVMPPTAVWSYAANATTYSNTTCNGADANVGKPWAAGSGAMCYAKNANGAIYDMSGNVAEWTATQVLYNNTTYYKVRGGAFNTFSNGTNCNFDFVIQQPTYEYNDVGFRCCSDNPP
jgi:formylglycine-generating enzyme required for sulfatase activity